LEIETLRFGRMTVDESRIITFPRGILGFARHRRYVAVPHGENSPFIWLQSVDDGTLAFVVMDPRLVEPAYSVDVDEASLDEIEATTGDDLEVVCIVTIPHGDPSGMTINLMGPVIINMKNKKAVQVVCEKSGYSHRRPIISQKQATP